MERTNRMISRQDAAEILRCSQLTISNYVKNGIIKGHIINDRLFVDADTIAAITDTAADIEASKIKIDALKTQLQAEEAKLVGKINDTRSALGIYKAGEGRNFTKQIISALLCSFRTRLSELQYETLDFVVHYGDAAAFAERKGISVQSVVKIINKACSKIVHTRLGDIEGKIEMQAKENSRLMEIVKKTNPVLDERLDTHDFSVRALTIFKEVGAVTLRDLVRHHKSELMKTRVPSKKAMAEIEDFVKCKGIEFGMAV